MADIKILEYHQDIDINSIFERKIELGAVIQFNLLQRVLEEFIKRQKLMNDKILILESRIAGMPIVNGNDIDSFLDKSVDENIFKIEENFYKNKENENNNMENHDNIEDRNENKEKDNKIIKENKDDKNIKSDKENISKTETMEKNDGNKSGNIVNKLNSKIEKLEKKFREMANFINKSNNEIKSSFNDFKTQSSHANKYHENKINELFKKISYINDFEMFQIDNKPKEENRDVQKEIVKSIEQNLSERIENLEKKNKINDDSIYSIKKDIVTIKNINDNTSKLAHTNQDNIINISKDLESKINLINIKLENEIKNLKDNCDKNYKENRYEIIKYNNEFNDKMNNLVNELNKNMNNKNINSFSISNEKLNNLSNELKNYINHSINDTEKYLKSIINNLNIDSIKKDISEIHDEINQNKLMKKDIELINSKISDNIEKKILELNQKLDAQSTDVNLCNDTCNKTVKMVEYLSGQMNQTYQPDLNNHNEANIISYKDLKQNIDMTSYMTKDLFKEEKNKILKKIEKTLEIEGENYIFIQRLEERIKFLASENDLRNMEQNFINLLEELKIVFNKKFLDKNEAQKSLKLIELQLKQIIEIGTLNNKDTENWMLAKKPINNYVCASCETYLGELKNKNKFLPWNKIPLREEKKYRMGQGFSKMLQLINLDLLKNADMVDLIKCNDKNDEKKINEYKKLPKIKSQINFHNKNKNYSMIQSSDSIEHVEYELNNSADNVEPIVKKKNIDRNNMSSSYYNKSKERDKNVETNKNYNTINMKTNYNNFNLNKTLNMPSSNNQEPKVRRIVKIIKK